MRLPIHSRKPGAVHRATRYRWTLAEYSRTIFMVQPLGLRFPSPGSESKIIPDDPADGDVWLYQPITAYAPSVVPRSRKSKDCVTFSRKRKKAAIPGTRAPGRLC